MFMNSFINQYHLDNRYFDIFKGSDALDAKRLHVENVIRFAEKLYDKSGVAISKELLLLCAEHHDDGRVDQYRLLGKFWDSEISHNVLGLERFDKYLLHEDFENPTDASIQIFRDVMLYHGRLQLCVSSISYLYIAIITAADDLENAAACVSYLIREVETDAKGYRHDNPDADQTYVSKFVFDHFVSGEKFDKMKYCHTYGEYVLFAATLMTSCIKKYNFAREILLQPGYGYPSILAGYKKVFEATLPSEMAEKAYKVLCEYAEA